MNAIFPQVFTDEYFDYSTYKQPKKEAVLDGLIGWQHIRLGAKKPKFFEEGIIKIAETTIINAYHDSMSTFVYNTLDVSYCGVIIPFEISIIEEDSKATVEGDIREISFIVAFSLVLKAFIDSLKHKEEGMSFEKVRAIVKFDLDNCTSVEDDNK